MTRPMGRRARSCASANRDAGKARQAPGSVGPEGLDQGLDRHTGPPHPLQGPVDVAQCVGRPLCGGEGGRCLRLQIRILAAQIGSERPDYILPPIVEGNGPARERAENLFGRVLEAIGRIAEKAEVCNVQHNLVRHRENAECRVCFDFGK